MNGIMAIPGLRSERINMGPADIYFARLDENGDPGAEVYLGLTQDGATITYESTWHQVLADQYGDNIMNAIQTGEKVSCKSTLLESSKQMIAIAVPTAKTIGSADNPSAITFGRPIGLRATQICGRLRVHPISFGKADQSMDVIIYLAYNEAGMELSFTKDNEWKVPINYVGLMDTRREEGDQLFRIGEDDGEVTDEPPKSVDISPKNDSMIVGETKTFALNAVMQDNSNNYVTEKATWVSSDTSVVTVEIVGTDMIATAHAAGTTIISASYIGVTNTTSLNVTEAGA